MEPFSVNICVYHKDNADHFVGAVESVRSKQTLPPAEVVISVDGPLGDELEAVVTRYENAEGVKVVRLSRNEGHARARQVALEASSNNLIALMDADDVARPDRFELQMKYMADHEDTAALGGQISEFVADVDNVVGHRVVPLDDDSIKKCLKSRSPLNFVTVMLRRDVINSVGGFIDWYCEEDYYLWARLTLAGKKMASLPQTLVDVRVGEAMYARRGGLRYFLSERRLQKFLLRNRLIGHARYVFNVGVRLVVQMLMTNGMRSFVFRRFARSNKIRPKTAL